MKIEKTPKGDFPRALIKQPLSLSKQAIQTACASLILTACATSSKSTAPIRIETISAPKKEKIVAESVAKVLKKSPSIPKVVDLENYELPYSPKYQPQCNPELENSTIERPEWSELWNAFPENTSALDMFNKIGGHVALNGNLPPSLGRWENACVVRMLWTFHQLGLKTPRMGKKTVSGGDGEQYLFRVHDLNQYIRKIWGPPDMELTGGRNFRKEAGAHPSLVIMLYGEPDGSARGHATIYDGKHTVDNAGIGGANIYVWRLKCDPDTTKDPETSSG